MIKKKCFENNWIISKYKELKADPILIEKAIFAFELLGSLIENNVNLIFKGGTGLMLLIPDLKRLSIDIDILNESDNETLNNAFNRIIEGGIFNRWEEDKRALNYKIAKKHFKFFYHSCIEKRESYILLDIVQSNYSFLNTTEKSIDLPLFEIEKEIKVMVPTINSYIGDKLTAFAPKTIGIPYGKNKSMEIIKQLFDLGVLFERITNLKEISQIYKKISKTEASYRSINTPMDAFLNDSINTSFLVCQLDFRKSIRDNYTKELREGIRRIKSYIVGGKYSLLNAKEDASKVACLASLIRDDRFDIDIKKIKLDRKYLDKIKDIDLPDDLNTINKLKLISPESFYLWAIATNLI
ncbi:MAG: nucleotidyl transferase AbiEii/AbiGii toxin family protein [Candidatus Lokiarchaeota archaeon]|nr:nucleotidyl transferase AbiEii/AbiGii toxin family protein [Candidatus Lokiarchaeota archaeon]